MVSIQRAASAEVPAVIEFDEEALTTVRRSDVDAEIWAEVYRALERYLVCPYCAGRGTYVATLSRGDAPALSLQALCGQCMGTGQRDEADARAAIARTLDEMRYQFLDE